MKKALIIGGSGGLSSVVVKTLLSRDYKVWAVTRGKRELPAGVIPIKADRDDGAGFCEAVLSQGTNWDVVFDCIAMNAEHAHQDLQVISKVSERLIVVSTDSVYDSLHKKTPQTEDGVFIEHDSDSGAIKYGYNKRQMEIAFLEDMESDNSLLKTTILRPGHIYGPGFLLGCFPENSRQKELPDMIFNNKSVRLVGMGTYIIQPIYVDDLARVMVDAAENDKTCNGIFCIGGPEAVEARIYYETIAQVLGRKLVLEEIPLSGYFDSHPEFYGHLCHRLYDLGKLKATGIKLPDTSLSEGIRKHLASLGYV